MSGVPGKVSTGAGISLGADGYSTSSGAFSAGTTPPTNGALNIDASGYGGTFLAATNTSGSSITMSVDATTNTLTVNGNVVVTGTVAEAAVSEGPLTITGGTVTTSTPFLQATQSWNAGGVTFTGLKVNITDTASAAGSLLIDYQVGGATKFSVTKAGTVSVATGATYQVNGTTVLSATTLGSAVVSSSLTSVGTLSAGAVPASLVTAGTFGAGAYTFPGALAITGAFTGATTGAFSSTLAVTGATTIGTAQSTGAYTSKFQVNGSGGNVFVRDNGQELYVGYGGIAGYIGTAYTGSTLYLTSGSGSVSATITPTSFVVPGTFAINGAFTGATTGAFSGAVTVTANANAIELKQANSGSATYYVMDNTVETGGKRWRFGYTGASGIGPFSFYNATDGVTPLSLAANGAATFSGTVGVMGLLTATGGVTIPATGQSLLQTNSSTGATFYRVATAGADMYLGAEASDGSFFGAAAYSSVWYTPNHSAYIIGPSSNKLVISSTGTAVTGAATFSSTLAVSGTVTLSGSASGGATIDGSVSISIANGSAYTNSAYRGMVLITDKTSGETAIVIYNNGAGTVVSQTGSQYTGTIDTASKVNVFASSGTMKVQNNLSTRNFGITVFNGG